MVEAKHLDLEAQHAALREGANGSSLKQMHSTAGNIATRTTAAGFTLIAAIAKSLHHYTSGVYQVSSKLIEFLRSHIAAIKSALVHRIFDAGGGVGQSIVSAVRRAEHVFRQAAADPRTST